MSENRNSSREQGMEKYFFRSSPADFKKIPGSPIAYWVSDLAMASFSWNLRVDDSFDLIQGMITGDNAKYVRCWHEISQKHLSLFSGARNYWVPYNKGGEARKWYGNHDLVVDWRTGGDGFTRNRSTNSHLYFRAYASWSYLNSGSPAARYYPDGFLWDVHGSGAFPKSHGDEKKLVALLCSKAGEYLLKVINPTMSFQVENISALPWDIGRIPLIEDDNVSGTIKISKDDWDSYETSWDFTRVPLLRSNHCQSTLMASYQTLRTHWREMTLVMQRLEQENNRIFIDAYGLQDELTPEVPLNEITLTCNPHYRYGGDKSEEELEAMLLADTMRELVSYAVGCMLGRYSLDKPGLILANQGETLADYLAQVPQPSFPADDDNVIPMLDGDWFADDITLRFRQFLRVAFGDEHYDENLAFIEQALNVKGKRNYSLRDYFLSEFYADHVKRYKKRPIYWLFSSPKGSFNALIYMHRYRPDTVSVVLKYLRDYREKLVTEKERQSSVSINPATSQGDKTRALKEVERLSKVLAELEDYERDVLYPLATEQKAIDLDDGVKVNYLKFGAALKKITGLDAKEED